MPDREVVVESGVCLYSGYDGLDKARAIFAEVAKTSSNGVPKGCLRVRLPVGYVDKETENGNLYEMSEMIRAFEAAKPMMQSGMVHGTHGQHPDGRAELRPDEISHLVMEAWVDPKTKIVWNEWLVVPTVKGGGHDLIQLFLSGAALGTSIRGTAVRENRVYMRQYCFAGTDTVSNPSTGFYPGTKNETLRAVICAESLPESVREAFQMSSSAPTNQAVGSILSALRTSADALRSQPSKSSDSELSAVSVRLGVMESLVKSGDTSVQASLLPQIQETAATLRSICDVLGQERSKAQIESEAHKASTSDLKGRVIALEAEVVASKETLAKKDQAIKEGTDQTVKHEGVIKVLATKAIESSKGLLASRKRLLGQRKKLAVAIEAADDLRDHALKVEGVAEEARTYIQKMADLVYGLRDYAHSVEDVSEEVAKRHRIQGKQLALLVKVTESLRDQIKGVSPSRKAAAAGGLSAWVEEPTTAAYAESLMSLYPTLRVFAEELRTSRTADEARSRASKYLGIISKDESLKFNSEVASESMKTAKTSSPKPVGVEKYLGSI